MRFQRLVLAFAAFAAGVLAWQRNWLSFSIAVLVCAWLVLEDDLLALLGDPRSSGVRVNEQWLADDPAFLSEIEAAIQRAARRRRSR